MAASRTSQAADIDATVSTLKTQLAAYIAIDFGTVSPGDNPRKLFWTWLVGQIRSVEGMAQIVDTSNMYEPASWGQDLSDIDPFV